MANIKIPKPWQDRYSRPIDENAYRNRRDILRDLGIVGAGLLGASLLTGCDKSSDNTGPETSIGSNDFTFEGMDALYPATRNSAYTLDRSLSDPYDVTHYNNFYEFIHPDDEDNIKEIYKYINTFDTRDWKIEIGGLVGRKGTFHLGDLITEIGLEERTYRHRCVEAWAMAVPWTGFSFAKLIEFLQPENGATHVRMETLANSVQMPGIDFQTWWPWPYFEALRIDEAMNELAFIATGLFGKPLPKQNGAPVRLVIPWKYGFKSIKSIIKIDFVNQQPETFWNKAVPSEYGFLANVDPGVPHPRWSQETEIMIIDGATRPTMKYNGYGEFVAHLYQ
ncbi:MAG: protein-methionine-sulfoxide reductase catalytic subunit MsrP [Saprospiraceae bacterium]|nr:protein-methionine-sulfoxide reductase catalytic subunit MsrP [Saprospiraceae bacterium]